MKSKITMAAAIVLMFVSCSKDQNSGEIHKQISNSNIVSHASCCLNQTKFKDLFQNCRDSKEKSIDQNQYYLVKNILGVGYSKAFKEIIARSLTRKDHCIKFSEIPGFGSTQLSFDTSECNIEYNGYYYKSVLFVANAESADFNLTPILSPGIELYDDDYEEQSGNHDVIFGWFLDENSDTIEINIGEGDVSGTSRPIVVASLELCDGQVEKIEIVEDQFSKYIKGVSSRTVITPVITGLQVDYRYDNTKYSEVNLSAVHVGTNSVYNSFNDRLRDVHKNDVGSYHSFGFDWVLNYFGVNNTTNERICYNMYEYDWYASGKPLGWCYYKGSTSGTKINLPYGKRKFYDEWYSFFPSDLGTKEMNVAGLSTSTSVVPFENNKGSIGLKKQ